MDDAGSGDDDVVVGFNEEEVQFSKSSEFEAAVEDLWRNVAAVEEKPLPAGHACSVCTEPLTCDGAHRICCIPCGHVYGRSCLERWLYRAGNKSAKEVKVYVKKTLADVLAHWAGWTESWKAQTYSEIREALAVQKGSSERMKGYINVVESQMETLCEKLATIDADRVSAIDRMKKMAEEEGVTPKDLLEFVEHNYPRLPSFPIPQSPT
ncbi:hypothetical protein ACQ4PT_003467 [Festuca glaucescens]